MVAKISAAVGARRSQDLFIIARTDARAVHGLDEALRRGEQYLKAGADGIFIEAPQTVEELERVGRAFQGVPQIANMLEGGGQTPVLPPERTEGDGLCHGGLSDDADFPRRAHHRAGARRHQGRQAAIAGNDGVDFAEFKDITGYDEWARIEDSYRRAGPRGGMRRCVADRDCWRCRWRCRARRRSAAAQTKVRLAVGGQSALYYLPLTVTDRLGYFKDEGLDVEISDLAGGAKALQALIGGSADVVTGAFDHTIQMQAKGQPITGVVQLGRFPGFVLALVGPKAASYRGPADLKGMKIGVTAPGSSTHFMVLHMMAQAGLKAGRRRLHRRRRRRHRGRGGQARRDRRAGQRRSGDQPARQRERDPHRCRHPDDGRHPAGLRRPLSGRRALSVAGLCREAIPRPCSRWSTPSCAG